MAITHRPEATDLDRTPKSRWRWLFLLPLFVFVGVGGFLAVGLTRDPEKLPSALIDKPVPAFDLPPLAGREDGGLKTADLGHGQVMLVNVFASWCIPCKVEHPMLMRLAKEGIPVVGINYKDKPEDVARFLAEMGSPYQKIGADRDGRAAIDFGVYGVPETFIIGKDGKIAYRLAGAIQERELEENIRPVLKALTR
ncbi:cytochrome c biogenesis protein CcmG, thiol:disulfide interchange protein DsbE [Arboricoccus pini]|uniref:Cytochrome c biogenesis protein CcmG, thiol:disulfide interchange protein DsbE n=1 Tax=Arboricoccus pini TaxID=1963835 RepID=A0A212PYF9_9PROT|nr:DsbE family thiol:disulfide interchange protein [Arboricoccus pini]SNB51998.1 cytochrome c biogenesis protein CcmG, thiol:disulfide interchange protein DsbE [Arboricoccus pini]